MYIGAHVSIAGGVENAPERAKAIGAEVMQIFTRSPQGGKVPPITPDVVKKFKANCEKFDIKDTYVHAPYFINFASSNNRIKYGSISSVKQELDRASLLGAKYVMTHLGSAKDLGEKEAIKQTTESLKKVFDGYKGSAKLLIENSAGSGSIIGSDFSQISKILKAAPSPHLAGICLDTQHSFASGYDWKNNFEKTIEKIEKEIGLKKIKLIHANDSKTELGSKKDRHAHIDKGLIGIEAFKKLVTIAMGINADMICETPHPGVITDIEVLKKLRG